MSWARRGIAPLAVGVLEGWTIVAPAGPPRARPPYDDPVRTLAGRPVGLRMRPAIGFFHVGRQAVVTIHPPGWRSIQRWAVWTPRDGLVPVADFAPARARDLAAVPGALLAGTRESVEADLAALWADGRLDAVTVLTSTLRLLGLPGEDQFQGPPRAFDVTGARVVVPKDRHARAFEKIVAEMDRETRESRGTREWETP